MTLKEKFEEIKIVVEDRNLKLQYIDEKNNCISECEKIADEFAIGFAEWFVNNGVEFYDNTLKGNVYKYISDLKVYTIKELLEIYKKEKGL